MRQVLFVFLGGGAGSAVRYLLAAGITRWAAQFPGISMPWGTLACNVLASVLLGALAGLSSKGMHHAVWLLLAVGFCGGWSTFSTFSMDLVLLIREGKLLETGLYMVLSLLLCLVGFWVAFLPLYSK